MEKEEKLDEMLKARKSERTAKAGRLYSAAKVLLNYQHGGYIDEYGHYVVNINAGKKLLVIRYNRELPSPISYLNISVSKKSLFGYPHLDNVLRMEFDNQYNIISSLTIYEPGNWEKLLENEADGYIKSPVSPEARKQVAGQRPTVQIVDDKEASRQ
ncbi:hypothetical protein M1384_01360 [Candidatus Parvarchaeota archaeon]|jgi:hypothetical protein|nr:hypothetical protein [Candidatus Parvarchaeota archaeon]